MFEPEVLEATIQERMRAAAVPGLALAVVRGAEVIHAQGYGLTSVEDGPQPVTPQTLFRMGSVGKALTAAAVLRLVEAGSLDLDQPIVAYVPWFALSDESDPAAGERVTLRRLLSHTAGLPDSPRLFGRRDPDALEAHVREEVVRCHLVAPPGKVFFYSNYGYNLAGLVVQTVTGKPFAAALQELVFEPLAMRRTTFDPAVAMTYPVARPHVGKPGEAATALHRQQDEPAYYPSGGAYTTVLDLANFAVMQLHGGRFGDRQVLSPPSVAAMQAPHATWYRVPRWHYGLGLGPRPYKGVRLVEHNGAFSGYYATLAMVPEAQAAAVVLVNRIDAAVGDGAGLAALDALLDLPVQAPPPVPETRPDPILWPRFIGTYRASDGTLAALRIVDGALTLDWDAQSLVLEGYERDLYVATPPGGSGRVVVGFVQEEDGTTQLAVVRGTPFRRVGTA